LGRIAYTPLYNFFSFVGAYCIRPYRAYLVGRVEPPEELPLLLEELLLDEELDDEELPLEEGLETLDEPLELDELDDEVDDVLDDGLLYS
jgi:hypothetical protein